AGYNAGPNAVARWVREGKAQRGLLEFVEAIPYKETREYVAAVIRNYHWYSKLLNGEAPQGISSFWNTYGPSQRPATVQAPSDTEDAQLEKNLEEARSEILGPLRLPATVDLPNPRPNSVA